MVTANDQERMYLRIVKHSQLWSKLVDAGNEECNTKGATHHGIFVMHALTKAKSEIAYCLCDALDLYALIICERMILSCDTSVVDHSPRVSGQSRHCTTEMRVDLHNLLY